MIRIIRKPGISLLTGLLLLSGILSAQVVSLQPDNPPVDRDITVTYNAALGNKALAGYQGDVYLHTGVITNRSLDGHDWKYVVGNWGTADSRVLMKRIGPNLYAFDLRVKSFYGLREGDVAQQLAFVFRNTDGTLVGKTEANEDITVPVNGYKPPEQSAKKREFGKRQLLGLERKNGSWIIKTNDGLVSVRPFTPDMAEVVFLDDPAGAPDPSHAVILQPVAPEMNERELPGSWELTAGNLSVSVQKDPMRLIIRHSGRVILEEEAGFFREKGNRGVRFKLAEGEKIWGAGERAIPLDRRSYRLPLYNRPFYAYEMGATMLNYSMPLTLSSNLALVLFDNPQKGYVDIEKSEPGIQEWGTMGGTLRYFVVGGKDWPSIMQSYTALTGRQPLPPRWALGNLQSRMAYRNQEETDSIVTLMQKENFPMDAIILDFYWFGDSIQGHLGKLDWYKKAWPDPLGMIEKFRKQGIKTILITEPYIIDTVANYRDADAHGIFVTDSLGRTYHDQQFYFGPGSLIDIFKPEARDWFWQKYDRQIKNGIAAWWGDLGEPESHPSDIRHVNGKADEVHNIYGHYWDKMLFDKYAEHYPGTRLFHLQRSGFAGSQRYAAYPWTGDVSRSWGGFKAQLPLLLTMSMSGLGYIHSDAGGFAQGLKDDELYTRWLQFAVFTPILRPHGSNHPSEPVFWSEQTKEIVRRYMNLRYALLPYNYSLSYLNTTTGAPLMRPVFYHYPADPVAQTVEDEYFWGENLLVAPVIEKGQKSRKVYLPEGRWFDFHTGIEYEGSQWLDYPVSIENIPVFVKAGSFLSMTRPVNTTDQYTSKEFTIRYYPQGESSFVQYEDDGLDNQALATGKYELLTYKGSREQLVTKVHLTRESSMKDKPAIRIITLQVKQKLTPDRVSINGKSIKALKKDGTGYFMKDGWLNIRFTWKGEPLQVEITDSKIMGGPGLH